MGANLKDGDVKAALKDMASHVEVEAFVNDHHHHDDHDDPIEPTPPVALENDAVSRPFELMVGLVGRPTYGTFDPTFFLMLTFPMIYGLILGDFGYGFIIFLSDFGSAPCRLLQTPSLRTASPF